jgi:heme/copper-type cytochrome/quinol oxidase subunit 2
VLWLAAIGLLALALWRLAETVIGPHPAENGDEERGSTRVRKRGKSLALAIVYVAIAYSAVRFATGAGKASSERNAEHSAQMVQSTAGKAALILIGLVIVAVGGYHVYKGATKRFLEDLTAGGGRWITPAGVIGYVAKGIVLAGAGILAIVAAMTADPAKASGIDAAVKTLGAAPFGKLLLVLAAAGIAAFGLYSFVRSRYARM